MDLYDIIEVHRVPDSHEQCAAVGDRYVATLGNPVPLLLEERQPLVISEQVHVAWLYRRSLPQQRQGLVHTATRRSKALWLPATGKYEEVPRPGPLVPATPSYLEASLYIEAIDRGRRLITRARREGLTELDAVEDGCVYRVSLNDAGSWNIHVPAADWTYSL